MIKSKIDARERALEFAVKTFETSNSFSSNLFMDWVNMFEQYLIGDAELPETQSDTELLKAIQTGNAGISAEVPCKSETE